MPSYYDIDTILSEEELLTVKPAFDFAHLAHLDPDADRRAADGDDGSHKRRRRSDLPAGTPVKLPLWAVDRWALLAFATVSALPRHYRQRTKERLEADPVTMNLSHKTDYYFLSGTLLADLLLRAAHSGRRQAARDPARRATYLRRSEALIAEALPLQHSLLAAMMGDRLCRNFDWTLSALDGIEDDASDWVGRLTALERRLFQKGAAASDAIQGWRESGVGRVGVGSAASGGRGMVPAGTTPRDRVREGARKRATSNFGGCPVDPGLEG